MFRRLFILCIALWGAIVHAQATETPLLADSSFENQITGGYQYNPTGTSWTFTGAAGIQKNGSAWGSISAPDGIQTAFLQGQGSMSQIITLSSAGEYVLTFTAAQRACCAAPYEQKINVSIDGNQIGQAAPTSRNFADYTYTFSATAGSHTIQLTGTAVIDNAAFIDQVTITPAPTSEPAVTPGLANGSFESPATSSYRYNPTGANWTFTGAAGIQKNGSAWGSINAPDGHQTAFLQHSGSMTQNVTLPSTSTYQITFKAAQRACCTAPYEQKVNISIDGTQIGQAAPTSRNFTDYTYTFFATAGSHTLQLTGTAVTDNAAFIDQITITPVAPAAPAISLTAPSNNTVYTAPANIPLTATTGTPTSDITQVAFYQNQVFIGSTTTAPYSITWNNVAAGNYTLIAQATNPAGATATSSAVNIQVLAPPTATLTSLYYIQTDHLNTPRLITDQNNNAVWEWRNENPFGSNLPNENPSNAGNFEFNLRYAGQYFDKETGLHYNAYRDYDPSTGRYMQSDPIGLAAGPNTYAYVNNQPTRYVDPLGLNPATAVGAGIGTAIFPGAGTIVGAAVGTAIGIGIGTAIYSKPPENAYNPNGPKAPGLPGPENGYVPPKGGPQWVPNPFPGRGASPHGWRDKGGRVWCPTGQGDRAHGGPHWDVQGTDGNNTNVRPDENINDL